MTGNLNGGSIELFHVPASAPRLVYQRVFGRRDVVESFRFHPTLIVVFLKQIEFYYKF